MSDIKRSDLIKTVEVELEDGSLPPIQAFFPIPAVTPTVVDRAEILYYEFLLGDDEEENDEDLDSLDTEGLDEKQIREVNVARIRRDKARAEKRLTASEQDQAWYKAAALLGQLGTESSLLDDGGQRISISPESVTARAFPWLYVWPTFRAVFFGYRPKAAS